MLLLNPNKNDIQVQNGKYFDDSVVFGTGCIVGSFMGSYLNAIWCILLMSEMKKHSLPRHSYHTHTLIPRQDLNSERDGIY